MGSENGVVSATWALAISTMVLVAVNIIFGWLQVRKQSALVDEQRNSTLMDSMFKLNEMLNNTTSLGNRAIVFDVAAGGFNGSYQKVAEIVSGEFDVVGSLVQVTDALRQSYFRVHLRKTAKSWEALKDWIESERAKRNDPHFREYFESIGEQAMELWDDKYPEETIEFYRTEPK